MALPLSFSHFRHLVVKNQGRNNHVMAENQSRNNHAMAEN
jgi:hypothetical protein